MKRTIYVLLLALAATALISCSGRSEGKEALREMEKVVEKAEKNRDKLTPEEWKALAVEFEQCEKKVEEAIKNKKIGATGQIKSIALTTRWATAYGPVMLPEMISDLSEPLKNMGTELEKMVDSMNGDSIMQKALQEDTVKQENREAGK